MSVVHDPASETATPKNALPTAVRPLTARQQLATIWVFVKRDLTLQTRFKASYLTGLMATVQHLVIYAMIARFGVSIPAVERLTGGYVSFVLTGLALNILLTTALTGPYLGLMESFWSNRIEILLASPLRLPGFVIGVSVGKYVDAAVQIAIILGGGWLFFGFVWPAGGNALAFAVVLVPALAAVIGLGLAAAGMVYLLDARGGQDPVQFAVLTISSLVAGVYFPIQVLPAGLQWLCYLVPQTYALDGMRRALFGAESLPPLPIVANAPVSPLLADVGFLVVYAAVALPSGWLVFRRGMERARADGRLSRWL
jgi:ABC-2 type transport system permease protein